MAKNKNAQVKLVLTQLITDIFNKNKNVALNHKQVAAKLNLTDGASAETIFSLFHSSPAEQGMLTIMDKVPCLRNRFHAIV